MVGRHCYGISLALLSWHMPFWVGTMLWHLTDIVLFYRMLPSTFAAKVPDDEYFSEQPMRMKHKRLLAHFFVEVRDPPPSPPPWLCIDAALITCSVGDGGPLLLSIHSMRTASCG
jgi:hypothetical protein